MMKQHQHPNQHQLWLLKRFQPRLRSTGSRRKSGKVVLNHLLHLPPLKLQLPQEKWNKNGRTHHHQRKVLILVKLVLDIVDLAILGLLTWVLSSHIRNSIVLATPVRLVITTIITIIIPAAMPLRRQAVGQRHLYYRLVKSLSLLKNVSEFRSINFVNLLIRKAIYFIPSGPGQVNGQRIRSPFTNCSLISY